MTVRDISVKGEQLRFLAHADSAETLITGSTTGGTGTAGVVKVKATYVYWIDNDGNERRSEGTLTGNTGHAGVIKVKGTRIYYNDYDGNERYLAVAVGALIWSIASLNNGYPYLTDNAPSS